MRRFVATFPMPRFTATRTGWLHSTLVLTCVEALESLACGHASSPNRRGCLPDLHYPSFEIWWGCGSGFHMKDLASTVVAVTLLAIVLIAVTPDPRATPRASPNTATTTYSWFDNRYTHKGKGKHKKGKLHWMEAQAWQKGKPSKGKGKPSPRAPVNAYTSDMFLGGLELATPWRPMLQPTPVHFPVRDFWIEVQLHQPVHK